MAEPTKPQPKTLRHDLSPEYLRDILLYDQLTGIFRWRWRNDVMPKWNGRYAGTVAGSEDRQGHLIISVHKTHYMAHRLAWVHVTGNWLKNDIDHRDGDKRNNCFLNLREATDSQNNWNAGRRRHNTSGFKGVSWHAPTSKWVAQIACKGQHYYLGLHDTKEDAHAAYCKAAVRLHGEFARFS